MKENNFFVKGPLVALIVSVPLNIVEYLGTIVGVNNYPIWDIAASIYFSQNNVFNMYGFIIGLVSHLTAVAVLGAGIEYVIYFTGREYYLFKGLIIGLVFYVVLFGILLHSGLFNIIPVTGVEYIFHLILHIIFGVLTTWLIVKFKRNSR
ncbi:hypothetical protein [Natranaerobius trueperi]|uniref:DUF1440 domain-containing protein n=1 Tax=Natranaerobius trueperi TaxID=759412 RepID=A0A226C1V9_9FIRM|nr:hypothetical protein [Natranaerobius trueperi]OWZ84360.1 hypothetical protein CDO51_03610 [Natranaerobius trueperi]